MSEAIFLPIASVSLVSLISLSGVIALPIHRETLNKVVFFLFSLATGAMLGNALFNLLPESFEKSPALHVWALVGVGLVFCFVLERVLNLRCHHSGGHCRDGHFHDHGHGHEHGHDEHTHEGPSASGATNLAKSLVTSLSGPVLVVAIFQTLQSLGTGPMLASLGVAAVVLLWTVVRRSTRCRPCDDKRAGKPCCEDEHEVAPGTPAGHIHATGYMSIISHAMDNFMDGVLIAVAYSVSPEVGVATTLAIVLHEIPMEFGGFGILVNAGFSRWGAILINFGSAMIAMLGTAVTLYMGSWLQGLSSVLTPIGAGIVLHITLTGLLPQLHLEKNDKRWALQILIVLLGVVTIFAVHQLFPE